VDLRNIRIGTRLGIGFGILLTMLIAMLAVSVATSENSRNNLIDGMNTANAKVELANAMRAALLEGAVSMRNIGILSDLAAMEGEQGKVRSSRQRYSEARDKLAALGLSDAEKNIVSNITQIESGLTAPFAEAMQLAVAFDVEGASKVIANRINPQMKRTLDEINLLIELQQAAVRDVIGADTAVRHRLMAVLFALSALALLIGVCSAVVVTRSITRPLRSAVSAAQTVADGELGMQIDVDGADEVSELLLTLKEMNLRLVGIVSDVRGGAASIALASQQIASGNADLASRTEEQACSLEKTASSVEQLSATVKQNEANAHLANQLAVAAANTAVRGGTVMSKVIETMRAINASARMIVDIISVIDGIAFQTNILALNAAVEAARAGEQGRGFAVVASEVRNLAQRSAAAAKEIKTLIDNSVQQVDIGGELVDEAGGTMREVVESIKRVADIVAEISAASQEQTAGIEQVSQAMAHIDEVTQRNAALVEQSASASQAMREQAGNLVRTIGAFRIDGTLETEAHDFATTLQDQPLQAALPESMAFQVIHPAGAGLRRPEIRIGA
jgi:methyl-accepting chemotaxis protein